MDRFVGRNFKSHDGQYAERLGNIECRIATLIKCIKFMCMFKKCHVLKMAVGARLVAMRAWPRVAAIAMAMPM